MLKKAHANRIFLLVVASYFFGQVESIGAFENQEHGSKHLKIVGELEAKEEKTPKQIKSQSWKMMRVYGTLPVAEAHSQEMIDFIQDISNLKTYEPKISQLSTQVSDEKNGFYQAKGFISLVPWNADFNYRLHPQGFHSQMLSGPPGVQGSGGFYVKDGFLHHYETYKLSTYLVWLMPALRAYLPQLMKKEITDICKINRHIMESCDSSQIKIYVDGVLAR